MATVVPRGILSIAAKKALVIIPVAAPRLRRLGQSDFFIDLIGGLAIAMNIKAPKLSLSHAVPAGPICSISGRDRAEPSCMENIATIASDHAGGCKELLGNS
ncbi:MAG: hypothetical protein ACKOXT_06415 [Actinomycetota bacterium]